MEKKREAPRKGRSTPHGLYRRRPENILSFIRHKKRDLGTVAANTSTASSIQFLATVSTSPSPYLRRQKRCETRLQEIYSILDQVFDLIFNLIFIVQAPSSCARGLADTFHCCWSWRSSSFLARRISTTQSIRTSSLMHLQVSCKNFVGMGRSTSERTKMMWKSEYTVRELTNYINVD